jgi:hypothetical protein
VRLIAEVELLLVEVDDPDTSLKFHLECLFEQLLPFILAADLVEVEADGKRGRVCSYLTWVVPPSALSLM